jgi:Fe2+ or Zn2+ uptake regulation protein
VLTKNHRLVLEIVQESGFGRHRCASDIFAEAKRRRSSIGHTTIYRSLARLRDLGLVREVLLPHGNSATYEPMGPNHAHFHCTSCDNVQDVHYQLPEAGVREIVDTYGVAITSELLTFEGRCAACRRVTDAAFHQE